MNKVTSLKLEVGDKIMFRARKTSYHLLTYTPRNLETWVNSPTPATSRVRDAIEVQINANSASDDTTDADIDTIVMFQRIGD